MRRRRRRYAHELRPLPLPWPPLLNRMPPAVLRLGLPPRRPAVLVVGMSHADALLQALEREPVAEMGVVFIRKGSGDRTRRVTPQLLAQYEPQVAVSMLAGNEHALFSLLEHEEPYDFVEPTVWEVRPERRFVTRAELMSAFAPTFGGTIKRLKLMRRRFRGPMAHVAPPPPTGDEVHLGKFLGHFAVRAQGREVRFAPGSVRLKMYRLQNAVVREVCREAGIAFIGPPAEALGPHGFLTPPYRRNDPTHGNVHYGSLVRRDILAFARAHGVEVREDER